MKYIISRSILHPPQPRHLCHHCIISIVTHPRGAEMKNACQQQWLICILEAALCVFKIGVHHLFAYLVLAYSCLTLWLFVCAHIIYNEYIDIYFFLITIPLAMVVGRVLEPSAS